MEGKNTEKFNPLVSIIIPVYNGANYMREAIDSALAQTYKNIEVIVINDGSTDETDQIAKSYGNKIRYFKKENGGVATALNLAIKKSEGEYISWLSHDDIYLPEKIEAQIDLIKKTGEFKSIIFSDWTSIDKNNHIIQKNKLVQEHPDRMEYYLIFKQAVYGCSLLIHKDIFKDVGLFPVDLPTTQDYTLWLKMAEKYRFLRCPISLVCGRKHSEQGSNCLAHMDYVDNFFRIQIKRLTGAKMTRLFPENERLDACIKLIHMLNDRNLYDCSVIFYNQVKKIFSENEQNLLYKHLKNENGASILMKIKALLKCHN